MAAKAFVDWVWHSSWIGEFCNHLILWWNILAYQPKKPSVHFFVNFCKGNENIVTWRRKHEHCAAISEAWVIYFSLACIDQTQRICKADKTMHIVKLWYTAIRFWYKCSTRMLDFSELIWWGLGPKIGLIYSVPALQTSWSMATADKKVGSYVSCFYYSTGKS